MNNLTTLHRILIAIFLPIVAVPVGLFELLADAIAFFKRKSTSE